MNSHKQIFMLHNQCWGKLLLKVMHYNIVLLPKKKLLITLLSYFLWNVMRYVTFAFLFKSGLGLLVWFFYIKSSIFGKFKSPFTPKSEMNNPQAEGK